MLDAGIDVVDVEDEKCGRECAALWDAVSDGLLFELCIWFIHSLCALLEIESEKIDCCV